MQYILTCPNGKKIDMSSDILQQLERKIEILNGIAENLPVEDVSVDLVLCSGVFMFTQQELALKEIARVLKPDGKVCFTVNGLGYFIMYILNNIF